MKVERLLFCLALLFGQAFSVRVLESQIKLGNTQEHVAVSGAKLDSDKKVASDLEGLTICVRFNLKTVGGYDGSTLIWHLTTGSSGQSAETVSWETLLSTLCDAM